MTAPRLAVLSDLSLASCHPGTAASLGLAVVPVRTKADTTVSRRAAHLQSVRPPDTPVRHRGPHVKANSGPMMVVTDEIR